MHTWRGCTDPFGQECPEEPSRCESSRERTAHRSTLNLLTGAIAFVIGTGFAPPPDTEAHPYLISKITIEQQQVFDESDTTLIHTAGKLANRFHIMTDPDVIRRELLFKEGDPYDQRLVDESARHLRRLGILGGIRIAADTLPDSTVNVTVHARDRWTLRPEMSLRGGGGVSGFSLGVRDDNLFGAGQKATVGYSRLSDRRNPNGGEASFLEPRLFGSWWSGSVQYQNADELRLAAFDLERPFFSDAATWAVRGYAATSRTRFRLYQDGVVTNEAYLNQETELAWAATSTGDDSKLQLGVSYVRSRASADSMQIRPFDNVDFIIGEVSVLQREFHKGSFIENYGRIEDVPLGYQFGVMFGPNLHLTHLGSVDYFARVFGLRSLYYTDDFFASYQASATSYFIGHEAEQTTVSGTMMHNWRITQFQTLLTRVTTTIGSHWEPSSQLTLGSFSGLRGYRNFEFSGDRLFLVNLEDRAFSGIDVWFLRFGGAFFFDSGTVWNEGQGLTGQRFHSAVGIGVRVESGKNYGSGIFRFDIAYNLDQRRIGVVLSLDHLFRGFSDMEFVPPVPTTSP